MMSKMSFKELKDSAEGIYQRYDAHFAGKARATRDIGLIDDLIAELEQLLEAGKGLLNGSKDPALLSVLDMAKSNLEVYRNERVAIAEAQSQGPMAVEASRIIARANLIFGQYHRHYAGKDRRTRDLRRMDEIVRDLEAVEKTMASLVNTYPEALKQNLEIVRGNLSMYRNERNLIAEARTTGTPTEQADMLANLANEQFKTYRDHFAGKSRHTRRPTLLGRMIAELEDVRSQMRRLGREGLNSEANTRNIDIVTKNLELYQGEVEEIRRARQSVTSEQYAGSLGAAANAIMDEYREHFAGQNRATRDLERMTKLCDGMHDIALQMEALDREEPTDINSRNLEIVLDTWSMYEEEYNRIEQAKSGSNG
jgi:hypothetical protein